ncbi:MAG: bud neck involved protein [Chaenotheca gracillima]|nr:MAG: bud neck involved protein [Chaenotheca gracillima]
MSTTELGRLAPLATPLPTPPVHEVLTPAQWTTLMAIASTVVPEVLRSTSVTAISQLGLPDAEYDATVDEIRAIATAPPDVEVVQRFLAEGVASYETFRRELRRYLTLHVREDARNGMGLILSTLNTRAGSLILTGSTVPFHEQTISVRTDIMRRWSLSYLPPLRAVCRILTQLSKSLYAKTSTTLGPLLDFPRAPVHGTPGQGYDFQFVQFGQGSGPETIECDVVIVGSGCGAGVTAKNLAEDGHRVLVVEKSYHFAPEHLPMSELDGSVRLFEGGAAQPSDDGSITVSAGSSWGGGGTVNWSASLQTQGFVRKEWADQGLNFFTSAEYQNCLDRVCHRMGVSTEFIEHNHGNQALMEGCRKLGYSCKAVPQNTGGKRHYCGYCTMGCGSAEKQGPAVSWLPDAARAGAQFMEGFEVTRVLFDENNPRSNKAIGVTGIWTSRDEKIKRPVVVKAKKTIISAGTLWSPVILQKSGLKNPQIGRNLKLHPANWVFGIWPEEVRPWEGAILTSVCDEFQNQDGQGHGVKLEAMVMLPNWMLAVIPGRGLDFKKTCLKFKHMNAFITLCRDSGSGRIYPDPNSGHPRMEYTPSVTDRKHTLEGLLALAKIIYVTGAKEISTVIEGVPSFVRSTSSNDSKDDADPGINDPAFLAWLDQIRAVGVQSPNTPFGSAHQMGTCRMGISEKTSVVDPRGRVWGAEDLYVADASVFPSASGVNPMITNMAISDWISRGVAKDLRREEGGQQESARL